ncbi:MAG: hypothetical protein V3571_03990 [Pseudodesulfovibrio sp.]
MTGMNHGMVIGKSLGKALVKTVLTHSKPAARGLAAAGDENGGVPPRDPKGDYSWTVHPKPDACDKCKALEGKEFMEEPERPHPNCKCEIRKHPLRRPKRYINGSVTGYSLEVFVGGKQVDISFDGISGGITSGVLLMSNQGHSEQIACMPFTNNSTTLSAGHEPPVNWRLDLIATGSDNVMINYTITYEDWSE